MFTTCCGFGATVVVPWDITIVVGGPMFSCCFGPSVVVFSVNSNSFLIVVWKLVVGIAVVAVVLTDLVTSLFWVVIAPLEDSSHSPFWIGYAYPALHGIFILSWSPTAITLILPLSYILLLSIAATSTSRTHPHDACFHHKNIFYWSVIPYWRPKLVIYPHTACLLASLRIFHFSFFLSFPVSGSVALIYLSLSILALPLYFLLAPPLLLCCSLSVVLFHPILHSCGSAQLL